MATLVINVSQNYPLQKWHGLSIGTDCTLALLGASSPQKGRNPSQSVEKQKLIRKPLLLIGDEILDGNNRAKVAKSLGMDVPTIQYDGPMDREAISDLLFDEHLAHRQLNEGTKAVMAVKRLEYCKREAKEAKIEAGKLGGKIGGRGREKIGLDTTESNPISRKASARAAAKVGLSYASVERAAKAISNSPLVEKPLEQGKLKIREALFVSELPEEKQQEIIILPKEEIPKAIKKIREEKKELEQVDDNGEEPEMPDQREELRGQY